MVTRRPPLSSMGGVQPTLGVRLNGLEQQKDPRRDFTEGGPRRGPSPLQRPSSRSRTLEQAFGGYVGTLRPDGRGALKREADRADTRWSWRLSINPRGEASRPFQ